MVECVAGGGESDRRGVGYREDEAEAEADVVVEERETWDDEGARAGATRREVAMDGAEGVALPLAPAVGLDGEREAAVRRRGGSGRLLSPRPYVRPAFSSSASMFLRGGSHTTEHDVGSLGGSEGAHWV